MIHIQWVTGARRKHRVSSIYESTPRTFHSTVLIAVVSRASYVLLDKETENRGDHAFPSLPRACQF